MGQDRAALEHELREGEDAAEDEAEEKNKDAETVKNNTTDSVPLHRRFFEP